MMGIFVPIVSFPSAMTSRPCYPLSALSTKATGKHCSKFFDAKPEEAHVGAVRELTGLSVPCILAAIQTSAMTCAIPSSEIAT